MDALLSQLYYLHRTFWSDCSPNTGFSSDWGKGVHFLWVKNKFSQRSDYSSGQRGETIIRWFQNNYFPAKSLIKTMNTLFFWIFRYPLPGPAPWEQSAEGCFGPDHRGTATLCKAGTALRHGPPGSAGPTQVSVFADFDPPLSFYPVPWSFCPIPVKSWQTCFLLSSLSQGIPHPLRENRDGSVPQEAVPRRRGGHWWVHEADEGRKAALMVHNNPGLKKSWRNLKWTKKKRKKGFISKIMYNYSKNHLKVKWINEDDKENNNLKAKTKCLISDESKQDKTEAAASSADRTCAVQMKDQNFS